MQTMITEYLTTLIRTLLAPIVAYLLATGFFTDSQVANFVGAVAVILVAAGWGLLNKYWWKQTVDVALTLPANSSPSKLQDVMEK